jgi:serine/threonine protein kinase
VLRPTVAGDLRSAARFQREARTAASLVHPCIVPILGFGEEQGCSWLAMGLVEGRSLQRLLAARDAPGDVDHARANEVLGDPRWLATALADAADALDFAHRKNVVHRDVKPGNLMVGDDGKLLVLDFGLASARPGDESTESLTRTGDFLGTPLYMAPEQTAGADAATARSDVYALGAVLYECLCGAPPVPPGPLPAVLDAIRSRDPDDPARRRAGVPPELGRVAMQCLEKEPARRYESAAALADDLRRFVDGQPVRARARPGAEDRAARAAAARGRRGSGAARGCGGTVRGLAVARPPGERARTRRRAARDPAADRAVARRHHRVRRRVAALVRTARARRSSP